MKSKPAYGSRRLLLFQLGPGLVAAGALPAFTISQPEWRHCSQNNFVVGPLGQSASVMHQHQLKALLFL